MTEDRFRSLILERIAHALGMEPADILGEPTRPLPAHEALELLSAFERVSDARDRRACLEFVRSVAARQPTP